jgi:hypothetical protein
MQGRDGVKAALTENAALQKKLLNEVRAGLGIEARTEISSNGDTKQKEKSSETPQAKSKSKS